MPRRRWIYCGLLAAGVLGFLGLHSSRVRREGRLLADASMVADEHNCWTQGTVQDYDWIDDSVFFTEDAAEGQADLPFLFDARTRKKSYLPLLGKR